MNVVKINIHNSREGILTLNGTTFTCISDQEIKQDDIVIHPQYSRVIDGDVFTFVVKNVLEQRPSRGDWNGKQPATWRHVEFKKEKINGRQLAEIGIVRTEEVIENGNKVNKTFINF